MATFETYAQGTPNWVELITPDQEAAKAFYSGLFGWEVTSDPIDDQGGVYLIGRIQGDAIAGIGGQMPDIAGHPAFWGVYLAADDVDEVTAKVEAAGGRVEAGPFDVMDAGRMAAVQDPTGARVNFWQAGTSIGSQRANEPGTPIWNELHTPDIARATRFYADVLGMGAQSMEMGEGTYTCLTVGDKIIAGTWPAEAGGPPPHWNVYFNVASTDDTVVKAQELGARVLEPAYDVPGVGRMAALADPQGAVFQLMQNPD